MTQVVEIYYGRLGKTWDTYEIEVPEPTEKQYAFMLNMGLHQKVWAESCARRTFQELADSEPRRFGELAFYGALSVRDGPAREHYVPDEVDKET